MGEPPKGYCCYWLLGYWLLQEAREQARNENKKCVEKRETESKKICAQTDYGRTKGPQGPRARQGKDLEPQQGPRDLKPQQGPRDHKDQGIKGRASEGLFLEQVLGLRGPFPNGLLPGLIWPSMALKGVIRLHEALKTLKCFKALE